MPVLEIQNVYKGFSQGFWGRRTPVLKGLSLILAGRPKLLFVLAMDREKVAASVATNSAKSRGEGLFLAIQADRSWP